MSATNAWCFVLVLLAGNTIGMSIGYVPVVIQSYVDATNCSFIGRDQEACNWADKRICSWNAAARTCEFTAKMERMATCDSIASQSDCQNRTESCIWQHTPFQRHKSCQYQQGWTKQYTALVATMSTFGGIVGSVIANAAITRIGVNYAIAIAGITATVSSVLLLVGWQEAQDTKRFGMMLGGRFVSGLSLGLASAAIPIYIGDVASRSAAGVLGVGFQVFITFGIMTASLIGFAANSSRHNLNPRGGVQAMNIYSLVLSSLLVPAAYFAERPIFDDAARNSLLSFRHSAFLRMQAPSKDSPLPNPNELPSLFRRPIFVAVAVLIAAGQQFSGINMIISYVTSMCADLGMFQNPYLAGFVVMIWNFVSTLAAIYLAYRVAAGSSFLLGELVAALACFVIAIPVRFYSSEETIPQAFMITGVMVFIFAFEIGMGPSFYVLAQTMFPAEIRAAGCSFTIFSQFSCNALVNFLYPILVSAFSGGESHSQDHGIGIMFFIFGAMGIVMTIALKFVMNRIRDDSIEPGDETAGPVETRDALTQY
jgi:MFS family permease